MLLAAYYELPVAWLACGAAVIMTCCLAARLPLVRGTTLLPPMVWAVISGVSLAAIGALEGFQPVQTISRDALRFAVTVGTFCPVMAVLGAKRPQDRGWQWIVLSLWAVAVWPAVQAALLPAGTVIDLFIVWKLFLVGLVVVGLLNYLPTQYWKESNSCSRRTMDFT